MALTLSRSATSASDELARLSPRRRRPVLAEIAASYEAVWRERMDLADRVDELEREISRHREVEELMRTTLLTAERASQDMRDEARREAG